MIDSTTVADSGFVARMGSRKFLQAVFIQVTAALFVWFGKMDAGGYITISMLTLSIYSGASIVDKAKNPSQQP